MFTRYKLLYSCCLLGFQEYKHEHGEHYIELLMSINLEDVEPERYRELIQNVLRTGNLRAEEAQDGKIRTCA